MSTGPAAVLPGRGWVRLGRLAWIGVALLALGLVGADAPYRFEELHTYCLTLCEAGRLLPSQAPVLQGLGLTLDAYAVYVMALYVALTLACSPLAAFVFLA